jgi:hypothetical protein
MKPHETSAKKRKLSEPVLGVIVSIGVPLLWILTQLFALRLSESIPLRITLISAGTPMANSSVSVVFEGGVIEPWVQTDREGMCSLKWKGGPKDFVSVMVAKTDGVLFDAVVKVPTNRKLRLAVDKDLRCARILDHNPLKQRTKNEDQRTKTIHG